MARHLTTVDTELAAIPGVVSVWCASATEIGIHEIDGAESFAAPHTPAAYAHHADVPHRAASAMKVAILAALYRAVDAGRLDLGSTVLVHNEFASAAPGAPAYGVNRGHDSDEQVWHQVGSPVRLGWLAERMIVRSSNLATNLVLAEVGLPAVRQLLADAGLSVMAVGRGIEDDAAIATGITNLVSATDLGRLYRGLALGTLVSARACVAMLDILAAQEFRADLIAGLPPGTRAAVKNGWLNGIRHSAGVVFPDDAPPFVLAVCLTTPLAVNRQGDEACQVVARIAAAAWADRHDLT
jgi:beta-lactamase class A